jgi:hypothetical protein
MSRPRREAVRVTPAGSLHRRLAAVVASYRHLHEEHRRAGPGGHTRRHLEAQLEELSANFVRLLDDAALDDALREQWRRHLYHGTAEPDLPAAESASPPSVHRPPRNRSRGSAPFWQR